MRILTFVVVLGLAFPGAAPRAATVDPSSVGPAPAEDAELLWEEGRKAFGVGRYELAERHLKRLTDRYPAFGKVTEARLLLGLTRLRQGKIEPAITALKAYVEATGWTTESLRGRLSLAKAYLQARKSSEALLTATEILNRASRPGVSVPDEIRLEALLLKASALLQRGRDRDAGLTLAAFESAARDEAGVRGLRAHAKRVEMELILRRCSELPPEGPATERAVIDAIRDRGSCLIEALTPYRAVIVHGDGELQEDATERMIVAVGAFKQAVDNPPRRPGRFSAAERAAHRKELAALLHTRYQAFLERAGGVIEHWRKSESGRVATYLERLLAVIEAEER